MAVSEKSLKFVSETKTVTNMNKQTSKRQVLYNRYEYLAGVYASKIFAVENIAMEQEDIEQEFKMLIWEAIGEFAKKWRKFRMTKKYKPVPLPFYLKNCLINKTKDLTKKINHPINHGRLSVERDTFDVGVDNEFSIIDFEKKELVVRGVDFLSGLSDKESSAFCMFIKGHKVKNIKNLFKDIDVKRMIENQVEHIKSHEKDLLIGVSRKHMSFSSIEE